MQKLKGLWIPAEILLNKNLSDKEKVILAIILYLSEETKSCFASNKYIANIVNVTHERVSKIISSLKDKGYVSVKLKSTFSFTNTKKDANVITSFFGTFSLTNDFKFWDIFTYKSHFIKRIFNNTCKLKKSCLKNNRKLQ